MFARYAGWAVSAALPYIATTIGTSRPSSSLSRSSGAAPPTGLPRAASRRGDGLRRRRGSTRPTAPQELERHARDLPGAFGDRRREQMRARMERRMERSADTEAQDDRARTRSNAGSRALGSSWRRLLGLHSERLPVLAQRRPPKDPRPPRQRLSAAGSRRKHSCRRCRCCSSNAACSRWIRLTRGGEFDRDRQLEAVTTSIAPDEAIERDPDASSCELKTRAGAG